MSLTVITGIAHLATSAAYIIGVGGFGIFEAWKYRHVSKSIVAFGIGLFLMAASCGPHHLHTFYHYMIEGGSRATISDLVTILYALPFGALWLYLASESVFRFGPGDRFITGRHMYLQGQLFIFGFILLGVIFLPSWKIHDWTPPGALGIYAQFILVMLYTIIGWLLWTGQWFGVASGKLWSLSGRALAMIFPTCALTHMVWGLENLSGYTVADNHFSAIDTFGILAAIFFIYISVQARRTRIALGSTTPVDLDSDVVTP